MCHVRKLRIEFGPVDNSHVGEEAVTEAQDDLDVRERGRGKSDGDGKERGIG